MEDLKNYCVTYECTQFFVNMIIAGIIIFGGGPVVIPLLRGYTVDNGILSQYISIPIKG